MTTQEEHDNQESRDRDRRLRGLTMMHRVFRADPCPPEYARIRETLGKLYAEAVTKRGFGPWDALSLALLQFPTFGQDEGYACSVCSQAAMEFGRAALIVESMG